MMLKNRGMLAALTAYFLWATPPVVSVYLIGSLNFFQITFWMHVAAAAAVALVILTVPSVRQGRIGLTRREFLLISCAGCSQAGMYLVFHFVMQNGDAVAATIIHNIWPVLLILLSAIVFSGGEERPSRYQIFLSLFAFLGATLLISGGAHDRELGLSSNYTVLALVSAAFAALNARFNKAAIRSIEIRRGEALPVWGHVRLFTARLVLPSALLAFAAPMLAEDILSVAPDSILLPVFLGVVTYFVASVLFSVALATTKTINLAVTAYLTPLISILLLIAMFVAYPAPITMIGGATVLLVVFQLQNHIRYLSAGSGTPVVIVLVGTMIFLFDWFALPTGGLTFQHAELAGAVFAIILGFSLFRLVERRQRQENLLLRVLDKIVCFAEGQPMGADGLAVNRGVDARLSDLCRAVIDLEYAASIGKSFGQIGKVHSAVDNLQDALLATVAADRRGTVDLHGLRSLIDEWMLLRTDHMPRTEVWCVWFLAAAISTIAALVSGPEFPSQMVALGVGTVVLSLCLTMRDLDLNRKDSDFARLALKSYRVEILLGGIYLPRANLEAGLVPLPPDTVRVSTTDLEGKQVIRELAGYSKISEIFRWLMITLSVVATIAALALTD